MSNLTEKRCRWLGTLCLLLLLAAPHASAATRRPTAPRPAPAPSVTEGQAAAAAPAAPDPAPGTARWDIRIADGTLNTAMTRWASQAGWQVLWELPIDYAIETNTTLDGTFEQAVATVADSMAGAEIPIKAIFYEANKTLRIVAKGGY